MSRVTSAMCQESSGSLPIAFLDKCLLMSGGVAVKP